MPSKNFFTLLLCVCVLTSFFMACDALPSISNTPTATVTSDTSHNPSALNVWHQAAPGVELRYEDWKSADDGEDTVTITRFDLHHVHLSVGYQPTHPLSMSDWMQQEQAIAIINGGYFDKQNRATGLVVSDGQASGSSYKGFGGMVCVDAQGAISLRSLYQQPYGPATEQLQQATQSSPMLVLDGQRTHFNANANQSRRSVVAMDKQGHMLFIASAEQAFSLDDLADLLSSSDLSIQTALNLDGGASTGLYMNAGSQHVTIDSINALPIVIVVKAS